MNSPRCAPAGLLVRYRGRRIAFDAGPGADPPPRLDAWLVTDEQAELRSALQRMAADRGLEARRADCEWGELVIRACSVAHTSHPTCGYRIEADGVVAVWAPEFWEFPSWAMGADLMFAEAAGWDRRIRFRGGVGGHAHVREVGREAERHQVRRLVYAHVREVGREAERHQVRRLVYAHIGRPCLRAMDAGLKPEWGEWGRAGRTYSLLPAQCG
ncbi:hypothetical protein B1C81_36780 [Streptomyces sp. HG99]|nr:hypothetical protein B1C81_36780 [Streptomyces sp. HG99]